MGSRPAVPLSQRAPNAGAAANANRLRTRITAATNPPTHPLQPPASTPAQLSSILRRPSGVCRYVPAPLPGLHRRDPQFLRIITGLLTHIAATAGRPARVHRAPCRGGPAAPPVTMFRARATGFLVGVGVASGFALYQLRQDILKSHDVITKQVCNLCGGRQTADGMAAWWLDRPPSRLNDDLLAGSCAPARPCDTHSCFACGSTFMLPVPFGM